MKGFLINFFVIFFIAGAVSALTFTFASRLLRFGGHRIQRRNIYNVALSIFFTVVWFGLMEPNLYTVIKAVGTSIPLTVLFSYLSTRSFSRHIVNGEFTRSQGSQRVHYVLLFIALVCMLIFQQTFEPMADALMILHWPLLSLGLAWIFSSIFLVKWVDNVERTLGKPVVERIKNT